MRSQTLKARPRVETLEDRTLLSTCHVTRLSDAGIGMGFRGDLRFCINKVNTNPGADIIDFHVTGTINLTGALPDLASDIDIQGPGAASLTVRRDTGGGYRIFTIPAGQTVGISGLTITNGDTQFGGGIHNGGSLTVRFATITLNGNSTGTAAAGGGIYNIGSLTLDHTTVSANGGAAFSVAGSGVYNEGLALVSYSTVADNFAYASDGSCFNTQSSSKSGGGGIYNRGILRVEYSTVSNNLVSVHSNGNGMCAHGGGIYNWGGAQLFNSTISNNTAELTDTSMYVDTVRGGGVYNGGNPNGALLTIEHSTITGNTNFDPFGGDHYQVGGGVFSGFNGAFPETLNIRNSIIADNFSKFEPDFHGALTSSSFNIFGNSDGGIGYDDTDQLDVDPLLGSLADNGGPTLTHALLPGSPAIDAGDNTDAPDFDQRGPGFPRIVNGTIDIGAFEVQATGVTKPPSPQPDFLIPMLMTADWFD